MIVTFILVIPQYALNVLGIPEDWNGACIISLYKGKEEECASYIGIEY